MLSSTPIRALVALFATFEIVAAAVVPTPTVNYPNPTQIYGPPGATNIYDPTGILAKDNSYLVYGTFVDLIVQRSLDRINWVTDGLVFPNGTPWCDEYVKNDANKYIWAPDVHYAGGKYVMYYACSTMGKQYSAIFLATSATGRAGQWTNEGVVYTSEQGDDYNAIDPNLIVDPQGRWWLTFGSFWTGIKQTELDPRTGKPFANSTRTNIARRTDSLDAIEASFVYQHGKYYYLFVSFDICCVTNSNYRIMMGRSTSIHGPFYDRAGVSMLSGGGTQLLFTHGNIQGPGGQSVFKDHNNVDVLIYHYYLGDARMLGLNNLAWDSHGWPYIV